MSLWRRSGRKWMPQTKLHCCRHLPQPVVKQNDISSTVALSVLFVVQAELLQGMQPKNIVVCKGSYIMLSAIVTICMRLNVVRIKFWCRSPSVGCAVLVSRSSKPSESLVAAKVWHYSQEKHRAAVWDKSTLYCIVSFLQKIRYL